MLENQIPTQQKYSPGVLVLFTIVTFILGFVIIGPLVGGVLALVFFNGSMSEFQDAMQNPAAYPGIKIPLYIMLGTATLVGLIIAPLLMLLMVKKPLTDLFTPVRLEVTPILLTIFIVIIFMGVNKFFIDWNASVQLPEFMHDWARQQEDKLAALTKSLTLFNTVGELILALVVIALLPAIGEELVFRGLIQKELINATGMAHLSIWLSAFIFSFIHLQFFGFIPRLLLGALFGYLYHWSGNIYIPMLAHFVNNGFTVLVLYFYQRGSLEFDIESTEPAPVSVVFVSAFLSFILIYYFKRYHQVKSLT